MTFELPIVPLIFVLVDVLPPDQLAKLPPEKVLGALNIYELPEGTITIILSDSPENCPI